MNRDDHAEAEEDEGDGGIRAFIAAHAIQPRTMSRQLRWMLGLGVVQMGVAALLMVLLSQSWPQIPVIYGGGGYAAESETLPVLVVTMLLLCGSWTFIISSTLHCRGLLRPLGPLIFLASTWEWRQTPDPRSLWSLVALLCLIAIVALPAATLILDRISQHPADARTTTVASAATPHRDPAHQRDLVFPTLAVTLTLVVLFHLSLWMGRASDPFSFSQALVQELQLFALLLVPALILAGIDFAEWAQVLGKRVATIRTGGRHRGLLVVGMLLLVAILVDATTLRTVVVNLLTAADRQGASASLIQGAVMIAAVLVIVVVLRISRMRAAGRPPYGAVILAGLVPYAATIITLLLLGAHANSISLPSVADTSSTAPASTPGSLPTDALTNTSSGWIIDYDTTPSPWAIQQPPNWTAQTGSVLGLSGPLGSGFGHFDVVGVPAGSGSERAASAQLTAFTEPLSGDTLDPILHPDGPWLSGDFTSGTTVAGRMWLLTDKGTTWCLVGWSDPRTFSRHAITFDALAATWSLGSQYAPRQTAVGPSFSVVAEDVALVLFQPFDKFGNQFNTIEANAAEVSETGGTAALVLLAVGCTLLLLFRPRLRQKGSWVLAWVFLILCSLGLTYSLWGLRLEWLTYAGKFFGGYIASITQSISVESVFNGTESLVAISATLLGVISLGLAVKRRMPDWLQSLLRLVLAVMIAMVLITLMYDLLDASQYGSLLPLPAALFVLLSLLWDLLMSGEAITNKTSRWLPRHARVVAFLGYELMIATLLLFYSALFNSQTGTLLPPQFQSDFWPQHAMIDLGLPLLLVAAAVSMVGLLTQHHLAPLERFERWWVAHLRTTTRHTQPPSELT